MLDPWPVGINLFDAATAKLPSLCEKAIRFLVGMARVGENDTRASLGRL